MKKIIFLLLFLVPLISAQQRVTKTGIQLLKHYEGVVLRTYPDAVKIPTIGYGHTGKDVHWGMIITSQQAEAFLVNDLTRFERYVQGTISRPLKWHEFDALTCFTYNVGSFNQVLKTSINEGNTKVINYCMMQIVHGKGSKKILPGLVSRRKTEFNLYSMGILKFFN